MNRLVFSVNSSEREVLIKVMKLQSEALCAILYLENFMPKVSNLKISLPIMHSESGELERCGFAKFIPRKFSASVRKAVISNYVNS